MTGLMCVMSMLTWPIRLNVQCNFLLPVELWTLALAKRKLLTLLCQYKIVERMSV